MEKKILLNLTSVLMVIILRMGNVEAQTSVNANWRLNFGSPDTISWSSSQTDNFGNIFVVGSTIVPNEGSNIYVNKVSRYGSVIWEYNYNGLSSGYDYGIGITIDNSGRIFVVGTSYTNSQNGYDITTISLSPNGTLNWVQLYNGTGNGPDLGTAIKCDLDGDIIVIGTSNESGNDQDYKIIKYNTLGSQEWDANYDYNNLSDISVSLEINSNNEILVTGASSETNNQWDIATALFNEDGVLINVRREPASGLGISRPTSVSKDLYGHFYITGITLNSSGNFDIRTIKLDSNLTLLWTIDYDAYGNNDEPNEIAIDNLCNVYVTGTVLNGAIKEWIVLKYNPSGILEWQRSIKGGNSHQAQGKSIAIDQQGNIIVTGSVVSYGNYNISTYVLSPNNSIVWTRLYKPDTDGNEFPTQVQRAGNNSIFILGYADWSPKEYILLQYDYIKEEKSYQYDTLGRGKYVKNQLVIRFHPDSLIQAPILDRYKEFGSIGEYISESNLDIITNKLSNLVSMDRVFLRKINYQSSPLTTTMRTLNNEEVNIEPRWNEFLMLMDCNGNEDLIIDSLKRLFPLILSIHKNTLYSLQTCSSNFGNNTPFPYEGTTDNLYENQLYLHGDTWRDMENVQWTCKNTGSNMTILFLPNSVKIDNAPITQSSTIGVFYVDNGKLKCAGSVAYDGINNSAICIWGDDVTTNNEKEGYSSSEEIQFYIKIDDHKTIYRVYPTNTITYTTNGMDVLSDLIGFAEYHINIETAWKYHKGTSNVRIGVPDTGLDLTHEDIPDNCDFVSGFDYISNFNSLLSDKNMKKKGKGIHL